MSDQPNARKSSRWRWPVLIGATALLSVAGVFFFNARKRESSDPRATYSTHFLNVRPDVAYVGAEECATCHGGIAASFQQHPMGKSLGSAADYTGADRYSVHNPFQAVGYEYGIRKTGTHVFHREKKTGADGQVVFAKEVEVHYGVGAGTAGSAFLWKRDGYVFQSPISWFPEQRTWDLPPGFNQSPHHPHFERPISTDCLYCHADRVEPVAHTANRYREPVALHAIGCERCHGPGALHVRRHENAEGGTLPDFTIVNPVRLEPVLRDAVCEQCHVHPDVSVAPPGRSLLEYRPGLPLHLFQAIFLIAPEVREHNKFGHRVEQMQASGCYEKSAGKFGCISCHDPHRVPGADDKIAFFRGRCLNCHGEDRTPCSVPVAERTRKSPKDDCVGCHMPRNPSNFVHVSLTDHRVQRPGQAFPRQESEAGQLPLVHFHQHLLKPGDGQRELGIALVYHSGQSRQPHLLAQALGLLEPHLAKFPDDADALEAVGLARMRNNDAQAGLDCFEKILATAPKFERVLSNAALAAVSLGLDEQAIVYLERAIAVNPYASRYHIGLGYQVLKGENWPRATQAAEKALELNPASLDARRLLVLIHAKQGHRAEALVAWRAFAALDPPDKEEIRRLLD